MKNIDEHIDLIERYLYDDLTQEELEEFNDLLRENTEFNKLFYEMDHLLDGIRRSAKQTTVEEKLARLEEALPFKSNPEINQESTNTIKRIIDSANMYLDQFIARLFNLDREEITVVPINSRGQASTFTVLGRIKLIAASSIIIVFLASYFIFSLLSEFNPSQIYADYYEKPVLEIVNLRSAEPAENEGRNLLDILYKANNEYNQSNYGKAIELIETVPEEEITMAMRYCSALSYMGREDFTQAINQWKKIEQTGDVFWQERAKWHLALCSIKTEQKDLAIKYLKEVSDIGGRHLETSRKLLKQLSR